MMNAVGSAGSGREWTSRPAAFAGMGNQALLNAFLEEFRRQQAKSCEQDVDKVKRSGKLRGSVAYRRLANQLTSDTSYRILNTVLYTKFPLFMKYWYFSS